MTRDEAEDALFWLLNVAEYQAVTNIVEEMIDCRARVVEILQAVQIPADSRPEAHSK